MSSDRTAASSHWFSHPIWLAGCTSLTFAASTGAAAALLHAHWVEAAAWLACALIGVGALVFRKSLPLLLGMLLALAAIVNTAGYVLQLWHERTPFDEIVHGFTTFAGVAAVGWIALRRGDLSSGLFWKAALMGLLGGLAWEAFEFAIGIIGDKRDTIIDLVMDTVGALSAAVLLQGSRMATRGSMLGGIRNGS